MLSFKFSIISFFYGIENFEKDYLIMNVYKL